MNILRVLIISDVFLGQCDWNEIHDTGDALLTPFLWQNKQIPVDSINHTTGLLRKQIPSERFRVLKQKNSGS